MRPPLTDQPQPAAVASIQMLPPARKPSSPRGSVASCTVTLARVVSSRGSTSAARHSLIPCITAAPGCGGVRVAGLASGPAALASSAAPSATVMITVSVLIGPTWTTGGPGMSYDSDAWLGRSRWQVLKLPSTKSDSVAVGLCDDRVSARKVEKQVPRPRALRLTPSSRNSPGKATFPGVLLLSRNDHGIVTFDPLTMAKVLASPPVIFTRLPPESVPVHR